MSDGKNVVKIIPSRIETGLQKLICGTIGRHIPKRATPNQITLAGALFGLLGIACAALAGRSPLFLAGTAAGLAGHLICDDLDGFVARKRNMASAAGAFFDLLSDILHITFLIVALAFSNIVSFQIAVFLVPVYALMMFTALHYILHFSEFVFPRLGPAETHLLFILICAGGMIYGGGPALTVSGLGIRFGDLVMVLGGIPMYYEMIRLQIRLFRRLKEKDRAGAGAGNRKGDAPRGA